MNLKWHEITVQDVLSVLDQEIQIASACTATGSKKKKLTLTPKLTMYKVYDNEIVYEYFDIEDAVFEYNQL